MARRKANRRFRRKRKQFKKKFNKRSTPAGDYFKRSFRLPSTSFLTSAYGTAGNSDSAQYDIIGNKINLSMVGLADASVFLKYFQYYRIKKIITVIRQKNVPAIVASLKGDVSDVRIGRRTTTEMIITPWRDGHLVSNSVFTASNAAVFEKMKQQKGSKYISDVHSKRMLGKGITIKQSPNTLDESFATQAGPLSFTHYSPQFNKWIANNYGTVDHYGLLYLIHNTGFNFSDIQLDTWVTVEYKGKITDPLIALVQNPSTNDDYPHTHHQVGDTTISQKPVDTTAIRANSTLKLQNDPDELDDTVQDNSFVPGDTAVAETIE